MAIKKDSSMLEWNARRGDGGTANAANIRALRERTGLTQGEFAAEAEVTVPTVKSWERGSSPAPARATEIVRRADAGANQLAELANRLALPEGGAVRAVRLPFFRTPGELMWWATLLEAGGGATGMDAPALAWLAAAMGMHDIEAERPEPNYGPADSLESIPSEFDYDSTDMLYGGLNALAEALGIDGATHHRGFQLAEALASRCSISRANAIFARAANVLEERGIAYSFYYVTDLPGWQIGQMLTPLLPERGERDGYPAEQEPPAEAAAKTVEAYGKLREDRLASGVEIGETLWTLDGGKLTIAPLPGKDTAILPSGPLETKIPLDAQRLAIGTRSLRIAPGVAPGDDWTRTLRPFLSFAEEADLSNLDVSHATSMRGAFLCCTRLKTVRIEGWDTSHVTDMSNMFVGCGSLEKVIGLEVLDTSNVAYMECTFAYCSSLTSLDVSNWGTSNVKSMRSMFLDCGSLTSLDVSGFDTSSVTDMSYMFEGCASLESLDLGNFDVKRVQNAISMFDGCISLERLTGLGGWNVRRVRRFDRMFGDCDRLEDFDDFDGWSPSCRCHGLETLTEGASEMMQLYCQPKPYRIEEHPEDWQENARKRATAMGKSPEEVEEYVRQAEERRVKILAEESR